MRKPDRLPVVLIAAAISGVGYAFLFMIRCASFLRSLADANASNAD